MSKITHATIIIRTLAEVNRFAGIKRAISSIRESETGDYTSTICVVVNGNKFDNSVLDWLRSQDLNLLIIPEASLPLAFLEGINSIQTPYFGFLDDDDEYLPRTLTTRIQALEKNPEWDVVITNGYKCDNGVDRPALIRLNHVSANPLVELFRENWIGSCTGLLRAKSFPSDFFKGIPQYLEWSYLGFQFSFYQKKIGVLNVPTFRINDTPGSASKSEAYQNAHIDFYRYVLTHKLPVSVLNVVQARLQDAWALKALYAMHARQFKVAQNSLWEVAALPKSWRYTPLALRVATRILLAKLSNLHN